MKEKNLPKKKGNGIKDGQLVVLEGNLPVGISPEEIKKSLAEDMKRTIEGVVPRLPQIKILHAGALAFKLPSDKVGETKTVEIFQGVVVDQHPCNARWEQSFAESGGGVPPICSSLNGVRGIVDGGDIIDCATCPHNQFGTAMTEDGEKGKGKACKNMKRLHIMLDGHELPYRLTLPPSSIKEADTFFSALLDKGLPMTSVCVKFGLEEAKSGQGIAYSQIRFAVLNQISPEEYWRNKKFLDVHLAQIRGQEIKAEEYETAPHKEEEVPAKSMDEVKEKLFP